MSLNVPEIDINNTQEEKKLYMVYVEWCDWPKVRHTRDDAIAEAERLANKTKKTTYIFMIIWGYTTQVVPLSI